MALDILRRTGGWCIELNVPLQMAGKPVDVIEIRAMDIGTLTRWQRGEIISSMALLAELSGIPEPILLTIKYPDADRVLLALYNVVPPPIQNDFTQGHRPLASSPDELPPPEPGTVPVAEDDPRFPRHDGPVRPAVMPAVPPPGPPTMPIAPREDGIGVNFDAPQTVRRVG